MNDQDHEDAINARDDAIFVEALVFSWGHMESGSPINEQAEAAAQDMIGIALDHGDHLMWAMIFRLFDAYVSKGRQPPLELLKGLNCGFKSWKPGRCSLDQAFELDYPKKGKPATMTHRMLRQLRADEVQHHRDAGMTLEVAIEKVCDESVFGQVSESQIKRDYLRYRRIK